MTRRRSCGLAHFTGTSHTNRETGIVITRAGLGTTFLAIAESGDDWRAARRMYVHIFLLEVDLKVRATNASGWANYARWRGGTHSYIISWFDGIVVVTGARRPNRTLQSLCSL